MRKGSQINQRVFRWVIRPKHQRVVASWRRCRNELNAFVRLLVILAFSLDTHSTASSLALSRSSSSAHFWVIVSGTRIFSNSHSR